MYLNIVKRVGLITLFLFLVTPEYILAQVDPLVLETRLGLLSGPELVSALNDVAEFYTDVKPSKAILLCNQALQLTRGKNDLASEAIIYRNLSEAYSNQANNSKALEYAQLGLEKANLSADKNIIAILLRQVGNVYYVMGMYEDGISALTKAYKIANIVNNQRIVIRSCCDLSIVYRYLGKPDKVKEYLDKAVKMAVGIPDSSIRCQILLYTGFNHASSHDYNKAIANFEEGKKLWPRNYMRGERYAMLLYHFANTYRVMGVADSSFAYYKSAMNLIDSLEDVNLKAFTLRGIGLYYRMQKNDEKALEYFYAALKLVENKIDVRSFADVLRNLAEIYESMGNFKAANEFRVKFIQLRETSYDEARKMRIKGIEELLENELNKERILDLENKTTAVTIRALGGVVIISVLAIIGLLFLVRRNKRLLNDIKLKQLQLNTTHVKMAASEERFRTLFENSPIGIYRAKSDGSIIMANPAILKMLECDSPADLRNLLQGENNTQEKGLLSDELKEILSLRNVVVGFERVRFTSTGKKLDVLESAYLVKDDENEVVYIEGTVQDVSDSRRAREALRNSEQTLRMYFESPLIGQAFLSKDLEWIDFNNAVCTMLGYTNAELPDIRWRQISTAEDVLKEIKVYREILKNNSYVMFEKKAIRKDGSIVILEVSAVSVKGNPVVQSGFIVQMKDITERKNNELALAASLGEKEILLKEIHHRVKNNLQIISSLINLQAMSVQSQTIKEVLEESQIRVRSMALIHDMLYHSGDFQNININDYISKLAEILFNAYKVNKYLVTLELDLGNIALPIDKAIPCGLIINEVISNSLKYAFPGDSTGNIKVEMKQDKSGITELIISDNGIGLPFGWELNKLDSLGMKLVGVLVNQLNGTLTVTGDVGTKTYIQF